MALAPNSAPASASESAQALALTLTLALNLHLAKALALDVARVVVPCLQGAHATSLRKKSRKNEQRKNLQLLTIAKREISQKKSCSENRYF